MHTSCWFAVETWLDSLPFHTVSTCTLRDYLSDGGNFVLICPLRNAGSFAKQPSDVCVVDFIVRQCWLWLTAYTRQHAISRCLDLLKTFLTPVSVVRSRVNLWTSHNAKMQSTPLILCRSQTDILIKQYWRLHELHSEKWGQMSGQCCTMTINLTKPDIIISEIYNYMKHIAITQDSRKLGQFHPIIQV